MGTGPSSGAGYASGNMNMNGRIGGMMSGEGRWWEAFGTGGFEGEPSLMEGESTAVRQRREEELTDRTWNQLLAYLAEIVDGTQPNSETG